MDTVSKMSYVERWLQEQQKPQPAAEVPEEKTEEEAESGSTQEQGRKAKRVKRQEKAKAEG